MTTRFVTFTTSFEGVHRWQDAPERVGFLRHTHRHVFHVEGKKTVSHGNRDVEFITLKHEVEQWLAKRWDYVDGIAQMGQMSCEMAAEEIANEFGLAECIVTEDGENGGGVIL